MEEKRGKECTCTYEYIEGKSQCVRDTETGHEVRVHPPLSLICLFGGTPPGRVSESAWEDFWK